MDLTKVSTRELSEELAKRAGVSSFYVEPYAPYTITAGNKSVKETGPAVIFVNVD